MARRGTSLGGGLGRLCLLCVVALVVCGGLAPGAAAEIKQIEFNFDDGRINLGQFKGERLVDPAIPERNASLTGLIETATGEFYADSSGLLIPAKTFQNVSTPAGEFDMVIHFAASGPIGGTFAPDAGALRTNFLNIIASVDIYQAGQPETQTTPVARCEVGPFPAPLDSSGVLVDDSDPENTVSYEAAPFAPRSRGRDLAADPALAARGWDARPRVLHDARRGDIRSRRDVARRPGRPD